MKIIVCLDDQNGMLFNHRRQSRDRAVIADVLKTTVDGVLYIREFSKALFTEGVVTDNACLEHAGEGDYCLIENLALEPYRQKIGEIIVYRWNRVYPADFRFDLDLSEYNLCSRTEFEGYSHERITKEVFSV